MGVKLPYLKDLWDVTPVHIILTGGMSEDGEPIKVGEWKGNANFSEKAKRVQDANGRWVRLSGVIHVAGDILPGVVFREGQVTVTAVYGRYGTRRKYEPTFQIVGYSRPRNPDGSVHHTRIEVI